MGAGIWISENNIDICAQIIKNIAIAWLLAGISGNKFWIIISFRSVSGEKRKINFLITDGRRSRVLFKMWWPRSPPYCHVVLLCRGRAAIIIVFRSLHLSRRWCPADSPVLFIFTLGARLCSSYHPCAARFSSGHLSCNTRRRERRLHSTSISLDHRGHADVPLDETGLR